MKCKQCDGYGHEQIAYRDSASGPVQYIDGRSCKSCAGSGETSQATQEALTSFQATQEALTSFMVWVDLDGIIRVEIGPDLPALEVRRTASLEDIANYSQQLALTANSEILKRSIQSTLESLGTPKQESTASIVGKALKKRKG